MPSGNKFRYSGTKHSCFQSHSAKLSNAWSSEVEGTHRSMWIVYQLQRMLPEAKALKGICVTQSASASLLHNLDKL